MTILISIVCSVVSAIVVHFLTINRIEKAETLKFRLAAYNDFLNASSRLFVNRRLGETSNNIDDLTLLNDAKNRMLLSAKAEVVSELINFWEKGGTLEREQEILSYDRLIVLLRQELGYKRHDLNELDVTNTLFKLEPSNFSYRNNQTTKI